MKGFEQKKPAEGASAEKSHLDKLREWVKEDQEELKKLDPESPDYDWKKERIASFQAEIAKLEAEDLTAEAEIELEDSDIEITQDDKKKAA